jgi:hypothetical protein
LPGADDDAHLDILSDFTEEDRSRINRVITKIGNIPSSTEPSERLHIVLVRRRTRVTMSRVNRSVPHQRTSFMRRLSVLTLTFAAAVTTASACGSDSDNPTTASSSSPAASGVSAPPSTVVETTVPAQDPGAQQDTDAAPEDVDVCTAATAEALLEALKSSPDFYRRVASPNGFGSIQCSAPFALATTAGTVQGSGVLFRRDGSRWTVLDVGSAIDCTQYGVTADDALEGCVV